MRRREFIALVGGAVVCPVAARTQQRMPVIGFLSSQSRGGQPIIALKAGLEESGYIDGRNVMIEYLWAEDRYDRLPSLAMELVRRQVAVIVAAGGPITPLAAKAATSTIPIIFTAVSDPVRSGLVASLNRPGANVTGVAALTIELDAKRLEVLRELTPGARNIGALVNPNRPDIDAQLSGMQTAAQSVGQPLVILKAGTERELDAVFENESDPKFDALLVGADPFFLSRRAQALELLNRHAMPAIFAQREFVLAGGLISYGASLADAYRQTGVYAGRILKGEKPADLPVVQPTKFELVINLKTAKALGLTVPSSLIARADEMIE